MRAITTHEQPYDGEERIAPLAIYCLVPDGAHIVRASVVADCASVHGLRYAAELYHTSPSTISRFLRHNGFVASRASRWEPAP